LIVPQRVKNITMEKSYAFSVDLKKR